MSDEVRRGLVKEAEARYREAAVANPTDAAPHKSLGDAFHRLGELEPPGSDTATSFYDSAEKSYSKARELDPGMAIPLLESLGDKLRT